ncbi:gas vesicle protein [Streptomyces fumigatiscleroticus]|nr:gas vesicle protein [Streptomyces fumigatiscleroticus]
MSPVPAGPPALTCAFAVARGAVPVTGRAGPAGRAPRAGDLRLLVQDVPAEPERCARARHRCVGAAARTGPAVPLPLLGTRYRSDAAAVGAGGARRSALGALPARLRDRTEWALKARADGPAAGAATDGRRCPSRADARRRTDREVREAALAGARAVGAESRRHAVAAARHRPRSERLTGLGSPRLLNAARLVDDAGRAAFAAAPARPGSGGRRPGVGISASGPWVPYSLARWDGERHGSEEHRSEEEVLV